MNEVMKPEDREPDYKAAMLYHSDRADGYMAERDDAAARIAELEADLKGVLDREAATYERHDAKMATIETKRDAFQDMCRGNYEAFVAMRNDINQLIGDMISSEATLFDSPEMSSECAAVVASVAKYKAERDAAEAQALERAEAKIALLQRALERTDEGLEYMGLYALIPIVPQEDIKK